MSNLEDNINEFLPAIKLTKFVGRDTLSILRKVTFAGTTTLVIGSVATNQFNPGPHTEMLLGGAFILGSFWTIQMMAFAFHNSYYFKGLNSIIGIKDVDISGATYDVAEAVLRDKQDITKAFCTSPFGTNVLLRSGLYMNEINSFISSAERPKLASNTVMLPEDEIFSLIGLGKYLLLHDPSFKAFLQKSGVNEDTFINSLRWIVGTYHQEKRHLRWWSKDNLSHTTGIGREWTYGTAFLLQKFSRDIRTSAVFSNLASNQDFTQAKITEVETALARANDANVIIVGEAGVGKMDLVISVAKRMRLGESLDAISGKQIIVLDTIKLFAVHKDKQSFEVTFINMLNEATNAGNTIIAIENLSSFITEAENTLGINIPELLDQYLALPEIQFIGTDTPGAYHSVLETRGALTRRFAEVLLDTPNLQATTKLIQEIALNKEVKHNVIFTYSAIKAIVTASDRHIIDGVMPDKAIKLLVDVISHANSTKTTVITDDFVYQTVSQKTGIPAGPIKTEEKELLLHLEDKLHQQVIGQQNAISAIAKTMRRARAGIQANDKPIGSFLFLGPTGVGKTETAKALAQVFFQHKSSLQRLDMSEYSDENSLEQLLGTDNQPGVLSSILRDHPYCVLLLDEFEKADSAVHDMFLQILDEGIFTDRRGMKINARNTIIIATSNAGSKIIRQTVQQRKDLSHLNQEIINSIIKEGIYRPELINRFDSTIIFEPLTLEQQTEVASLMLGSLYTRVRERGYEIAIGKELLDVLVKKGYDPEFGARPMQRVIQDVVEEKIAQKIISGTVQKGEKIVLTEQDFAPEELSV